MKKFKLTWRDLSLNDFKVYFFSLFKAFIPKSKIQNLDQLEEFIQTKSAWVSQVTLYSYLKINFNFQEIGKSKEIFLKILDDETTNNMPLDIIEKTKKSFEERFQTINWDKYYSNLPFNPSALSLYEWAPIAEELKTLDRKIVLNSVILKWDVIKKEFEDRIQF